MSPFSVTLQNVPDPELGPLLIRLAQAGFHDPIIRPVGADRTSDKTGAPVGSGTPDLPEDWRLVREREEQSYRWPDQRERYSRYRVFVGSTRAEGAVHIGLGEAIRRSEEHTSELQSLAYLVCRLLL